MFTGIIEQLGEVVKLGKERSNLHITIKAGFTSELQIDQSIAHNGACLTVVNIKGSEYTVTAIQETLDKTNLNDIEEGDQVNLERCMQMNGRIDGHIVQGHVDQVGVCEKIEEVDGSWMYTFSYSPSEGNVTVEKGSITINGTSLTVVDSQEGRFSVAIIPYTYQHTNFHTFQVGTRVNLEFDILGKYVAQYMKKLQA